MEPVREGGLSDAALTDEREQAHLAGHKVMVDVIDEVFAADEEVLLPGPSRVQSAGSDKCLGDFGALDVGGVQGARFRFNDLQPQAGYRDQPLIQLFDYDETVEVALK